MVDKDSVYNKIIEVLREELFYEGELEPHLKIKSLALDSIQLMQLFVFLEETYEFEFTDDAALENMKNVTLGAFVDYVHGAINPPGS